MGVAPIKPNCKYITTDAATRAIYQAKTEPDNDDEQDNFTRVLKLYPEYNNIFQDCQSTLMSEDGSLPPQSRYFIAILATRYSNKEWLLKKSKEMNSFFGKYNFN